MIPELKANMNKPFVLNIKKGHMSSWSAPEIENAHLAKVWFQSSKVYAYCG